MADTQELPVVWFELSGGVVSGRIVGTKTHCNRQYYSIAVDGRRSHGTMTVDVAKVRETQNEAIADAIKRWESIVDSCDEKISKANVRRDDALDEIEGLRLLMGD